MTQPKPRCKRIETSGDGEAEAVARLQAQQQSQDPLELSHRIEEKLAIIFELAHRKGSPSRAALPNQSPSRRHEKGRPLPPAWARTKGNGLRMLPD
jgi:hypothetical protein